MLHYQELILLIYLVIYLLPVFSYYNKEEYEYYLDFSVEPSVLQLQRRNIFSVNEYTENMQMEMG